MLTPRNPAPATAEPAEDWLSVQQASALLGVAPATLRRWGDGGRVPMARTLGGHRRFSRQAIARLAASVGAADRGSGDLAPPARPPLAALAPTRWGPDRQELSRQEWYLRLSASPAAGQMRGLGQRLLGLLIQYLNRREDDERYLAEARGVGSAYGRRARRAELSLVDAVQACLFFRNAFSQLAMPLPGLSQPTDLAEIAALHARLNRFMDAILLGVIAGYAG